jgi:homoserine kinase type II
MDVYILWHVHELPGGEEDAKLLGVYSSPGSAEQARRRAASRPGFRDAPGGFHIDRYEVDADEWPEGFVTVTGEDVREWRRRDQAQNGKPGPRR